MRGSSEINLQNMYNSNVSVQSLDSNTQAFLRDAMDDKDVSTMKDSRVFKA